MGRFLDEGRPPGWPHFSMRPAPRVGCRGIYGAQSGDASGATVSRSERCSWRLSKRTRFTVASDADPAPDALRRLWRKRQSLPESTKRKKSDCWVAGGRGFEPRLTESESAVLPLNYPPINSLNGLRSQRRFTFPAQRSYELGARRAREIRRGSGLVNSHKSRRTSASRL